MNTVSPVDALRLLIARLDELSIPYAIGGSFASSLHGAPRLTYDADLVADVSMAQVGDLVRSLQEEFYIDEGAVKDATARRSAFNVIHLQSMFKLDVFLLGRRPFDQVEFARRRPEQLGEGIDQKVYVTTPEGIILAKLEWYRLGGDVSERQYRDVLGVIRVQSEHAGLDWAYLGRWAQELGVDDLLQSARRDALGD